MYYKICQKFFHPVYKNKVAQHLSSLIPANSSILDIGCGKACISKILEFNSSLKITDLDIVFNKNIDVNADACSLPFKDKSFDVSICVDMLHHTRNILKILREIKRVTKNHIIIKEQCFTSRTSEILILLGDSLSNKNIKIFNHLHYLTLKEIFNELQLTIEEEPKNLNFGFFLDERMNQIFKLKIN